MIGGPGTDILDGGEGLDVVQTASTIRDISLTSDELRRGAEVDRLISIETAHIFKLESVEVDYSGFRHTGQHAPQVLSRTEIPELDQYEITASNQPSDED